MRWISGPTDFINWDLGAHHTGGDWTSLSVRSPRNPKKSAVSDITITEFDFPAHVQPRDTDGHLPYEPDRFAIDQYYRSCHLPQGVDRLISSGDLELDDFPNIGYHESSTQRLPETAQTGSFPETLTLSRPHQDGHLAVQLEFQSLESSCRPRAIRCARPCACAQTITVLTYLHQSSPSASPSMRSMRQIVLHDQQTQVSDTSLTATKHC